MADEFTAAAGGLGGGRNLIGNAITSCVTTDYEGRPTGAVVIDMEPHAITMTIPLSEEELTALIASLGQTLDEVRRIHSAHKH